MQTMREREDELVSKMKAEKEEVEKKLAAKEVSRTPMSLG
jgi:hypothetical protein